jgi:GT2 family glycosyltransferase
METNQKISFVIVNYRNSAYLDRCLASIFENVTIEKEIIIVNNCSEYSKIFENVRILNISENKGFGNTCNLGAKEVQGEILCFLNPDTEMISDDFEKIISEFKNDSEVGIIGPKLVVENDNVQEWIAGREISLSDTILNNLGLKRSQKIWESEEKVDCAWVSGASMFIRKELFEKLKGFDENFFMYFEDVDLCQRARKLGYKILYYPEFTIKHFGGKSFDNKKEQKKLYYQSQDYYFQKHFGKIKAKILKTLRIIS